MTQFHPHTSAFRGSCVLTSILMCRESCLLTQIPIPPQFTAVPSQNSLHGWFFICFNTFFVLPFQPSPCPRKCLWSVVWCFCTLLCRWRHPMFQVNPPQTQILSLLSWSPRVSFGCLAKSVLRAPRRLSMSWEVAKATRVEILYKSLNLMPRPCKQLRHVGHDRHAKHRRPWASLLIVTGA
jgi:hypothetical protein